VTFGFQINVTARLKAGCAQAIESQISFTLTGNTLGNAGWNHHLVSSGDTKNVAVNFHLAT
jgi:hypothetical protein